MRLRSGVVRGSLVVVLTAGVLGCGKQKPSSDAAPSASGGAGGGGGTLDGGTGGAGGRTGGGGEGGEGGSGPGGTGNARLPACVRDLFAACPIEGSCVRGVPPDAGQPARSCYSNGVTVRTGEAIGKCGAGPGEGIYRVEVTKPDGSPCYSFERCAMTIDSFFYAWKDAAGNVVASGSEGRTSSGSVQTLSFACAGGGATAACEYTPPAEERCLCIDLFGRDGCGVSAPPSPTCTAGTCP